MELNGIPIEHGMEVEQCPRRVPDEILEDRRGEYLGRWASEYQTPRELESLGPGKQVKSLLKRFNNAMLGHSGLPWEWSSETYAGHGCGSHAHITFADGDADMERRVKGMTIAWNTAVELTPFLAPFWCHDWENGFRSSVTQWAEPQVVRRSRTTMRSRLLNERQRSYNSVTLNPSTGSKPLTIEMRLNEAHPAFAFVGLTFLRRTMTKAMRKGWSPKLADDRRSKLNEAYAAIYGGGDVIEAMRETGPFRFEEGRGIPGSNVLEYDSMWDVLQKVFAVNGIDRGAYDDRVKKLVQAAGSGNEFTVREGEATNGELDTRAFADGGEMALSGSELGPQNNARAVWHTLDDDFSWDVGPEVA